MSRTLIKSITGVNFVDIGRNAISELYITNTYTSQIKVNIMIGQDDIAGSSSKGENTGAYLIKDVAIPVGVTLTLNDLDVSRAYTSASSGTTVDDVTILISLDSASSTADIVAI